MWGTARTLMSDVSGRPRTFCPRANPFFKYRSKSQLQKLVFLMKTPHFSVCGLSCTIFSLRKPLYFYNLLILKFRKIKEKSVSWRRMASGKGKKLSSRIESPITEVLRSRRCDAPAAILVGTLAITAVTKHLSRSLGSWNYLITRLVEISPNVDRRTTRIVPTHYGYVELVRLLTPANWSRRNFHGFFRNEIPFMNLREGFSS